MIQFQKLMMVPLLKFSVCMSWWMLKMYVLADAQNLGVGHFLMDKAIKKAKNKGFTFIWLGVWEYNEKAL